MVKKGEIIKCFQCGNDVYVIPFFIKRNKTHFCNKSCATKFLHKENRKKKGIDLDKEIDCLCGCGEKIKQWKFNGNHIREYKFKYGHNVRLENSGRFKTNEPAWNKGIPMSDVTKQKLSICAKEQHKNGISEETKIRMSCASRSTPISVEEFNGFVIDSLPRKNRKEKEEHATWRKLIFERDNHTCQMCGKKSMVGEKITLNAHHIKSWAQYPELRSDLYNGITLCVKCHNYVHSKKYNFEIENKLKVMEVA